jgi:RNA polymerase sigma-70 factor (ECF subfamily)
MMDAPVPLRLPAVGLSEKHVKPSSTIELSVATNDPPDEALMAQICQESREALAILFRRYSRVVRGVAYCILRDASEADDLLQDIFILIHRRCRTFDSSKGSAQFWILQMAYRRAISRRRYLNSRHFYTRVELDDPAIPALEPRFGGDDAASNRMLAGVDLQKMFRTLSEDQQKTLRLHFIEGYTLEEIARMLGQTKGNVRHHSFRGLERLRKQIFDSKLLGARAV